MNNYILILEIPTYVREILEENYLRFCKRDFIENDPIQIPHRYTKKQDIEIAGFFAAILAWGQRKTIIANSLRLMQWMDNAPHQFILDHAEADLKPFLQFKHRTFNDIDVLYFIHFLKYHYRLHDSLEAAFIQKNAPHEEGLKQFKSYFFSLPDFPSRTTKHISSPASKSTCKRLNMYIRWMVRKDEVDFGIWQGIQPADLFCPLDVHVERQARILGLLRRPQRDWETVKELTQHLKQLDPKDPVKYDFALFGLGISDKNH